MSPPLSAISSLRLCSVPPRPGFVPSSLFFVTDSWVGQDHQRRCIPLSLKTRSFPPSPPPLLGLSTFPVLPIPPPPPFKFPLGGAARQPFVPTPKFKNFQFLCPSFLRDKILPVCPRTLLTHPKKAFKFRFLPVMRILLWATIFPCRVSVFLVEGMVPGVTLGPREKESHPLFFSLSGFLVVCPLPSSIQLVSYFYVRM